jgi:hypothetical protein
MYAPVPDHFAVTTHFQFENDTRGPGYWKMNVSYLKEEKYCNGILQILDSIISNNTCLDYRCKWDLFKIYVKEFSLRYAKNQSKEKKDYLKTIEDEIQCLEQKIDKVNLVCLKSKLDSLKKNHMAHLKTLSNGAYIRSRAKYVEEGDRPTLFFLNLEKQHQVNNKISKLVSNNKIITNQTLILNTCANFYQDLYKSQKPSVPKINQYLEKIELDHILSDGESMICDGKITEDECQFIIFNKMKPNKAPGIDGIPVEFYRELWLHIKGFLLNVYNEIFEKGQLTKSQRMSVLSLIFKDGEKSDLSNYRPISLSTHDYKILAFVLAERLHQILPKIINPDQTGYVKKRFIGTNIRLV